VTNKVDNLGSNAFFYAYDPDSRLTNRWSAAKTNTAYGYDPVGNLTNISYPISHGITLAYDAMNQLTNMVDAVGATVYSHDAVGQLLNEDGPWVDDTVSYTYANRLRTGLSVLAPNASAWTVSYAYDAAKRLTNVTSQAGAFGYTYSAPRSMLPAELALPSGAFMTNTFDAVARLLSTTLESSQLSNLNSHAYAYDLAGQRIWLTNTFGDYRAYTYSNAGWLKTAQGAESGGSPSRLQEQFGYAYDGAGNLGYRTNNALTETFSVNSANELATAVPIPSGTLTVAGGTLPSSATNVTISGDAGGTATPYKDGTWAVPGVALPNGSATYIATAKNAQGEDATASVGVTLPASVSYTYDGNGNLLSDGNRNFTYNDENQLTSVWVTNVWRSDFAYDGRMRLRQRTEYAWSGSAWNANSTVRYVYDGNVVVQEQDQNNTADVSYTRGRDLSGTVQGAGGIGGLLARSANTTGAHAYYFADGNGNITCMTDTNQSVVASYLYDPYGRILSQGGWLAAANLYRFSSKEFHVNSGLVYYLYRFYDPNLQRWVNRDPIAEGGGVNLYGFVNNNAVGSIDALGLTLYYCTVPTSPSPPTFGIGRHAYLWNDATQDECGMESSCGIGGTTSHNGGPGGTGPNAQKPGALCNPIPGTDGTDAANSDLMKWCHQNANNGIWIPGLHDCHNAVNKCLAYGNLPPVKPIRSKPPPVFPPIPGPSPPIALQAY
jgi:RHS repeat-associated protein